MEIKTHEQILGEMLVSLKNTEDKSPTSFSYDVLSAVAVVFEDLSRKSRDVYNKLYLENVKGEELDRRLLDITGRTREMATYASGMVQITGDPDTVIPIGSIFKAGILRYESVDEAVIGADHTVKVKVRAMEAGKAGNVLAKEITQLYGKPVGVLTVENPEDFTNGKDAETDTSFRRRVIDMMMDPPKSGNPAHYRLWAEEIDGVQEAKVFRNFGEVKNVKVVVLADGNKVAGTDLVQAVKDHIVEESPIRYENLIVESAVLKPLAIRVQLQSGYADIEDEVKSLIVDNLVDYAFKGGEITENKLIGVLFRTPKVTDVVSVTINGKPKEEIKEIEIPTLQTLEVIRS